MKDKARTFSDLQQLVATYTAKTNPILGVPLRVVDLRSVLPAISPVDLRRTHSWVRFGRPAGERSPSSGEANIPDRAPHRESAVRARSLQLRSGWRARDRWFVDCLHRSQFARVHPPPFPHICFQRFPRYSQDSAGSVEAVIGTPDWAASRTNGSAPSATADAPGATPPRSTKFVLVLLFLFPNSSQNHPFPKRICIA